MEITVKFVAILMPELQITQLAPAIPYHFTGIPSREWQRSTSPLKESMAPHFITNPGEDHHPIDVTFLTTSVSSKSIYHEPRAHKEGVFRRQGLTPPSTQLGSFQATNFPQTANPRNQGGHSATKSTRQQSTPTRGMLMNGSPLHPKKDGHQFQ